MKSNKKKLMNTTKQAGIIAMIAIGLAVGSCSKKLAVAESKPVEKKPAPTEQKKEVPTLNTVWMVQQIKAQRVKASDFGQELPYIDLHTDIASFTGFAGCNRIKGKLVNYNDQLKFTEVISTRMECAPENKESEFLAALQKANRYEIHENMLYLFADKELAVILAKK